MLKNQKILLTGANGMIAKPLAESLARDNEVWGVARFSDAPAGSKESPSRKRLDALGIRTLALDVASREYAGLPADFTYVLHLAYVRGGTADFDEAIRINGEGTGFLLAHCRKAKAALVMSSNVVYAVNDDPAYAHREQDALGGGNVFWSPTSATAKIAEESIARYCARAYELPVTIARLNTAYGPQDRLMPVGHMDAVVAGKEVTVRWDPNPHAPIHTDDLCGQLEALLDAASVPANIVNWAGDEAVSVQDWCALAAKFSGREAKLRTQPVAGASRGNLADPAKRRSITGPCMVKFEDGYRRVFEARYPAGSQGRPS